MRFKAKLAPEQVSFLYALIGSITKLSGGESSSSYYGAGSGGRGSGNSAGLLMGGSVLRLDTNKVRLTTKGKNDADGVSFFCELDTTDGIFLEHRIQSAAQDDAIAMEIDLVQIRMALQSIVANNESSPFRNNNKDGGGGGGGGLQYSTTILKLAKRDRIPCLCLDAFTRDGVVAVHHSIPVRIMRVEDALNHLPPRVPMPDVQLELPVGNDRPLRIIAERLRAIFPHVYLDASVTGELTLRTHNEGSSIRTFFGKLIPRCEGCRGGDDDDGNGRKKDSCCLKVDTKKLVACLQWQQSSMVPNISNALLCFIENEMLVLHVTLNLLGFMTFYIPVHFLSDDEDD